MLEFDNLKEIKKYYSRDIDAYVFYKNGEIQDVKFNFDLNVDADIIAGNINVRNIKAWNINAHDIEAYNIDAYNIRAWNINAYNVEAGDIEAYNIDYYAFCIAYNSLKCKSIKGERDNSIHKCLDKEIEYIIDDLEEKVNKILDCSDCKFAACEQCEISYNDKQKIKKYIELLKGGN